MRVQRVARGVVAFAKRRLEAFDLRGGFLQALVRELGRAVFAREFGDEASVLLGGVGSRGAKGSDLGGDVREATLGGGEGLAGLVENLRVGGAKAALLGERRLGLAEATLEVEDGGAEFRGGEVRDAGATQVVGSRGSRRR